ncbi:prepilin-type N-terminal cleavage/methylation domain-containing protein [Chitinimonas viridis]|uniref:Prepilin-type N-terminal cleavage/methylation domain-containing protein n=1 Tax=Chitinimonas viridis TaxID=664880 RepID=A0ABT8B724_9NEIS|nr:prepilin-type N-terminal cleavage/methylation domain-containing protein [Chitinimonas viridis]MDN3578064.1 prepilin-type N-terminal cleavage/methylation domain-containing protein [Chitinimonas viridis]
MSRQSKRQRGFTLLEVLVALTILGLGLASLLIAYSGSLRLTQRAQDQTVAATLARSKLDETLASKNADIKGDEAEEIYNGTRYTYRITSTPYPLLDEGLYQRLPDAPRLEVIQVDVYWGSEARPQHYQLLNYHRLPLRPAAASGTAPPPANPPT